MFLQNFFVVSLVVDSIHSNFSTNLQQQTRFEPRTGAALMAQSGWNLRDPYGKPLAGTTDRSIALETVVSNPKFAKASTQSIKFERSPE